jgi:hypothetical protein
MPAKYWPAVDLLKQLSSELGLPVQTTVVNLDNPQGSQLLAALNSAGNELLNYYPWEQLAAPYSIVLEAGKGEYDLPEDWAYFVDQTQWDVTNHWPLLGPKSAQEWAYLKGGVVASFPRMRYRVKNDKFCVFPVPESTTTYTLTMEYVKSTWVKSDTSMMDMVVKDGDVCLYNPWLLIKFVKLKFYQLKGYDTQATAADFSRMFDALKGKDSGAQVYDLAPRSTPVFIGPHSIPDGNWNV